MQLEGLFGLYHFIYLIIFIVIFVITFYVFYAKLKDEKKRILGIKILAVGWLVSAIVHQIATVYNGVVVFKTPGMTWANLIPFTYCSFMSFATPIVLLCTKKDNICLHCLLYFCFFGGCSSFAAPWLNNPDLKFFSTEIISALIHHSFMLGMSIMLIALKYIRPRMQRLWVYPVGVGVVLLLGVFEKYVLRFPSAMMIGEPLFDKMPHLTSWWGLWLGGTFLVFVFLFLYEMLAYKKSAKQIFSVHNFLNLDYFRENKDDIIDI